MGFTKNNVFTAFPHVAHEHMLTLLKCYSICSSCARMCINENMKTTANLCMDCSDICGLAIKLHSSDSIFSDQIFDLCSDVCQKCAEECSKNDSEHCRQCAQICFECASACKR